MNQFQVNLKGEMFADNFTQEQIDIVAPDVEQAIKDYQSGAKYIDVVRTATTNCQSVEEVFTIGAYIGTITTEMKNPMRELLNALKQ